MFIDPYEMTKMVNLWDGHRNGAAPCTHRGDVKIEYGSGGGIGTRVLVTCGCGKEFDVTCYENW